MRLINLEGRKFGKLTVISFNRMRHNSLWNCICDCGKKSTPAGYRLLNGLAKSCGCRAIEETKKRTTTHGMCKTKTYTSWEGIIARCTNPKSTAYRYYGGRGIKVCRRWLKFENFLADMGLRPPNLTIDRINNDGNYCKSNCRWATRAQQAINKRQRGKSILYTAPIPAS